jgi:WXG100 family type VII secretion target
MAVSKVRTHHPALNEIAQQFGQQAEANRQATQNLRSKMEVLQGGHWKGESANKFYGEMTGTLLPKLQKLEQALQTASETTKKISQIMKEAESDTAKIFILVAAGGTPGIVGAGSAASAGGSGGTTDSPAQKQSATFVGGRADSNGSGDSTPGGSSASSPSTATRHKGETAIEKKVGEAYQKMMSEAQAEVVKFVENERGRMQQAESIARLKGRPEYAVRRAEFAKTEEQWLSNMDRTVDQVKARLASAEAGLQSIQKTLKTKRPEDITDAETIDYLVAKHKVAVTKETLENMQSIQKQYFEGRPELSQ